MLGGVFVVVKVVTGWVSIFNSIVNILLKLHDCGYLWTGWGYRVVIWHNCRVVSGLYYHL